MTYYLYDTEHNGFKFFDVLDTLEEINRRIMNGERITNIRPVLKKG